jgi:hypothetical protein
MQNTLTEMVQQLQMAGVAPEEARMMAAETIGDREQTLAEETAKAEWKKAAESVEVPEYVETTADGIRRALTDGGRAVVSVRSKKSGEHVTLSFACKRRKPSGQGWIARNTAAGRVGLADADAIEVRDDALEYPDDYVGRLYTDGNEWRAGKDADPKRAWTGEKVIAYALGGYPLDQQAEVFIATRCCVCQKRLTDPVSVERGIGPECFSKATGSKMAAHS